MALSDSPATQPPWIWGGDGPPPLYTSAQICSRQRFPKGALTRTPKHVVFVWFLVVSNCFDANGFAFASKDPWDHGGVRGGAGVPWGRPPGLRGLDREGMGLGVGERGSPCAASFGRVKGWDWDGRPGRG